MDVVFKEGMLYYQSVKFGKVSVFYFIELYHSLTTFNASYNPIIACIAQGSF